MILSYIELNLNGIYKPIKSPRPRKRPNQIRPRRRELIINPPSTSKPTQPTPRRNPKRKQRHHIPRVRVKHLLLRRVRRRANPALIRRRAEVFDVVEHHVRRRVVESGILPAADGRDVGRDAGVDGEVFFACVAVDGEAAEDFEAVAVVEFLGYGAEGGVEGWEGESGGGYVAEGFV